MQHREIKAKVLAVAGQRRQLRAGHGTRVEHQPDPQPMARTHSSQSPIAGAMPGTP